jgi:RNA polymerase sigma factor (sigma-70 family)
MSTIKKEIGNYEERWSVTQDEYVLEYIAKSVEEGKTKNKALKELAKKLGRTEKALEVRYYEVLVPKQEYDKLMCEYDKMTAEHTQRKNIVLAGGVVKAMNFEEVLNQFKDMINRAANETLGKIFYNKPEREDLIQELNLQCWEAYERYDEKHAFSTYLHYRLQLGVNKYTMGNYAKKRQNNGISSLDEPLKGKNGQDMSLAEKIGEFDGEMLSFEFREFLVYLEKILSDDELMILTSMLNKKDFSVADLAIEWGVSRVTANNRFRKFKERLAGIMRGTGFVAC